MRRIEYTDGETVFEGCVAGELNTTVKQPCLLVAHAWDGPNDYFNNVAVDFAKRGFVAFAIDVYGKGKRGKIDGDNSHLMNPLMANRALLQKRLLAGFTEAQKLPNVDPNKIVILGYCFGGLCAFDLARAAPSGLVGAIGIHASLLGQQMLSTRKITASILALHGWEDPVAKPNDLLAFMQEMTEADADWNVHIYGHAKHAFTFVGADIPELGIKYDQKAHYRSTVAVDNFLKEVLK